MITQPTSGVVTFAVGETSKNITIPIIEDHALRGGRDVHRNTDSPSEGNTHLTIYCHGYDLRQRCVSPPPDLVSWWPGDGNALDIQSGNNGTLQNGATFARRHSKPGVSALMGQPVYSVGDPVLLRANSK